MPRFTAEDAAAMISGFGSSFSVTPNSAAGIVGGASTIGGIHSRVHYTPLGEVDGSQHELIFSARDGVMPAEVPVDKFEIVVRGVADDGGDISYEVASYEEMTGGFRKALLIPAFRNPVSATTSSLPSFTNGVESAAITITAQGGATYTYKVLAAVGASARFDANMLYITPNVVGDFDVTYRVDAGKYFFDGIIQGNAA